MPDPIIDPESGLPLRGNPRTHSKIIIGHHLILHGYGHWLPNDPRGSGSIEIREEKFEDLGDIHFGRKKKQPCYQELKQFQKEAEPRLEFPRLWFDAAKRQAVGDAIGELARFKPYTIWACAVLKNHVHLVVRRHRDDGDRIWKNFADATAETLHKFDDVPGGHRIWSERSYSVFLYTPEDVWVRIRYVTANPLKEGLGAQKWPFVKPYDGWPYPK